MDSVEKEMVLKNTGKVPCHFTIDTSQLNRPSVVDIHPVVGLINPDEKQTFKVRFCAGIPDYIEETIFISVAHFEPVPFKIMGHGIFPGLVIQLERANRELHMTRLEEAKRR